MRRATQAIMFVMALAMLGSCWDPNGDLKGDCTITPDTCPQSCYCQWGLVRNVCVHREQSPGVVMYCGSR
jgi:hypothetical protein